MSKRRSDRVKVNITWFQPHIDKLGRASNAAIHGAIDELLRAIKNNTYMSDRWIRIHRSHQVGINKIELKIHTKGHRHQRKTEWMQLFHGLLKLKNYTDSLDNSFRATCDIDLNANRMPWVFNSMPESDKLLYRLFIRPGSKFYEINDFGKPVKVVDLDYEQSKVLFVTEPGHKTFLANEFYVVGEPRAAQKVYRTLNRVHFGDRYIHLGGIRYNWSRMGVLDDLVTVFYRNTEESDTWIPMPGFHSKVSSSILTKAVLTGALTLGQEKLNYEPMFINI